MPEESDRLIATAVRRMRDLELKLAAEDKLTSQRSHARSSDHFDSAEIIVRRWDQIDNRTKFSRWRLLLYVFAIFAILASVFLHFQDAVFYRHVASFSIFDMERSVKPAIRMMDDSSWSEEQRLLVIGDRARPEGERRRTLWERYPTDPAYFAEYVGDHYSVTRSLPPGYHQIIGQIDPDNAFFIYLEASHLAYGTVEQKRRTSSEKKSGKTPVWSIIDQTKLDHALAIAATAADKPRHNNYYSLSSSRKVALLRQDTREERACTMLLAGTAPTSAMRLVTLGSAYAARASQLAALGDREGFQALLGSADAFLKAQAEAENPTLVDLMVLSMNIGTISAEFSRAAATLGLTDEAARMKFIHTGWNEMKSQADTRRKDRSISPFQTHGDFIFAREYRSLQSLLTMRATLATEALLPGSFADHALASRGLALAMGVIFGGCLAFMALVRFAFSPLMNSLGERFVQLLRLKDYLWIILLGLIAPTLYVLSISYLSELGGRQWSLAHTLSILPTAHFAALLVMMVSLSVLISRWRLRLRTGFFGLASSWKSYLGWLCIIAAAALVPLIGWAISIHEPEKPQIYAYGGLLIPGCLWLIVIALRAPYGSSERRLTAATMSRILSPVFVSAIILTLGLAVAFQWEDDYWFQRYDLTRFGENGNPANPYEVQIQTNLQRHLQEILELKP